MQKNSTSTQAYNNIRMKYTKCNVFICNILCFSNGLAYFSLLRWTTRVDSVRVVCISLKIQMDT